MAESPPDAEVSTQSCLERTRSAVLNVLVVVGGGIAASGWILGRHDPDAALPWGTLKTRQIGLGALVAIVAASYATLRVIAGREALRDPARRYSRFFRGRFAASIIGALAIPLGFAYGWYVDSRLQAIAPFWVAALALGFLAMPRGGELDGFDEA
jgi:uncharacterized membrane protein YcjF (UPF0283 family)